MNNLLTKIKIYASQYKWLLIPIIPLILFLYATIYFISPAPLEQEQIVTPTGIPAQGKPFITPTSTVLIRPIDAEIATDIIDSHDHEAIDPEEQKDVLKTEPLADGTIRYTLRSSNASRPNIRLVKNETVIFKRIVISPSFPLSLSGFSETVGEPDRIIRGSNFYGSEVETQMYATKGFSIIANKRTNQVVEQHIFSPMPAAEYISKYGDDIPKNAK